MLADYPTFFRVRLPWLPPCRLAEGYEEGLRLMLESSQDYYYKLLSRVMTFPLHTIAAVNGHFFAGGLCLALACDWRICRVSLSTRSLVLRATRATDPVKTPPRSRTAPGAR